MDLNLSEVQQQVGEQQNNQQQQQQQHQQNQQQQQQQNQQPQQQQNQQQQQQNQQPPYTIPGILHYLQYEWHRFEVERQEWEVEKAELSARIALLQGEKKSHENLKHDLIRRIKMLEYCLRMERAKYHKLKHGTDPPPLENQTQQDGQHPESQLKGQNDDGFINSNNNSSTVTYGRELLRHYLQEIGYTDTIIDLRSNRVRSLLGIVDSPSGNTQQQSNQPHQLQNQSQQDALLQNNQLINSNSNSNMDQKTNLSLMGTNKSNIDNNKRGPFSANLGATSTPPTTTTTSASSNSNEPKQPGDVGEAEASVLERFGFLYDHEGIKDSSNLDEEEEDINEDAVDAADRAASTSTSGYSYFHKDRSEGTAMIRQKLDLFNNGNATGSTANQTSATSNTTTTGNSSLVDSQLSSMNRSDLNNQTPASVTNNSKNSWCPTNPQKAEVVDIGELATLATLDSETSVDDYRRKQWTAKYRLQSHYDSVRALRFSETDSLLVTVSDDETMKLWHLTRTSSTSGKSRQPNLPPAINAISSLENSTLDIEPIYTYRGHNSCILSVTLCKNFLFSGAQNGELIMWKLLQDPAQADPYAKFDGSLLVMRYTGHEDAIWSVEVIDRPGAESVLVSAGADGKLKLWSITGDNKEPIGVITIDYSPTCIAKMPPYNVCQSTADFAVSSTDGKIRFYDIATCLKNHNTTTSTNNATNDHHPTNTQPNATFESDDQQRINSIVIHPTLPYMASAGSNHDIRFWDMKTRECKSTMVAHLDEVTSLACDPTGKYLLSASHDGSVRLWLFEEKASCIQEITAHRKKFDEGIFAVAFHPNLSHFATAGADGLAKVFM